MPIRSSILAQIGDIGKVRHFRIHFERPAISAISETFPQAVTKRCTFHFRQAIMRRITRRPKCRLTTTDSISATTRMYAKFDIVYHAVCPCYPNRVEVHEIYCSYMHLILVML